MSNVQRIDEMIMTMKVNSGQASADDYSNLVMDGNNKLNACVKAAKEKGAKVYKKSMKTINNKTTRKDGKAVFIAWLPYLSSMVFNDHAQDSRAYADFQKAVSTMEADALLQ
ncbi:MAG: hypothetical protein ACRDHZ_15700 [Ktedonobacteraceae bacterium]